MPNELIVLNNKYGQFLTEDAALFRSLRTLLSFKLSGVEYTAAFQNGWNGFTYLIDAKGRFLLGLLNKVKIFLKKKNISYNFIDKRNAYIPNQQIDLTEKLTKLNMTPREHQNRIVDACLNNSKGIVRSCTSSGKTLATAIITAKLNKPTIIYVIGLDLLKQFHNLFSSLFDEEIGYLGDGVCNIKRINIASIWTVGKALNTVKVIADEDFESNEKFDESHKDKIVNMLKLTKLHIFDESHVVTTDTIKSIFKEIDPENIYGFSGTPFRGDNSDLLINGILGEQIIDISASELIRKGLIAQPFIKFVTVPHMVLPGANYQSIYKSYVTENDARNTMIVNQTKELIEKKYTPLVLFKQIKHGEILFEMMKDAGIKCEMLYGNDSLERRTEVKNMICNKEIEVILASTIFDIGMDLPILSALVLCGSGKSPVRALQRIGRVLRLYPGKTYAAVVDFFDQVKHLKKHSNIRCEIYNSEEGFKVFMSKEMRGKKK
jgi:superfamily II DNA or RNA helicase